MHLAMLSGVFAFSWSKWSASPTLGRRQSSNDSHKYVDLPDKVSSALCGVGRVNFHVCGGYCTCVWRAVYMCVFAYMYICVCIAIVHIPTVLIFAMCYIQSFMVACKTAKVCQVT